MFEVGDLIFYPMHGAGFIEAIEEKEILGENSLYYVLNIPHKNVQIMIPIKTASTSGMRELVAREILENVLQSFYEGNTEQDIYNNQRYCLTVNKTKIKSGDIYQISEIIRDLTRKSKKLKLGAEDKNMLDNARQIFTSEMAQVKGINSEQAVHLLDEVIHSIDRIDTVASL